MSVDIRRLLVSMVLLAGGIGSGSLLAATPLPPLVLCGGEQCDGALYDLGEIPSRFEAVEFADPPTGTSSCGSVNNQTELNAALASNCAITVNAGNYTNLAISSINDVDLTLANTANFSGGITIDNASRIRITGGEFNGGPYTAVLQGSANHVTFDNVNLAEGMHLPASSTGPHHISVLNSRITAPGSGYGILTGNGSGVSHLIVANCDISNHDAALAGVRWNSLSHAILIDSRVFTSGNRIFRLHADFGPADLVLLERNQFESDANHNLWLGPGSSGNAITRVEYRENRTYFPTSPGNPGVWQTDTNVGGGIDDVIMNDNEHFSPESILTNNEPTNFSGSNNRFGTYQSPPAFSGGADH